MNDFSLKPNSLVFMASGQGSQKPGMGVDLLDIPEVGESFDRASKAFGFSVSDLVTDASAETINETLHAQAAITALSIGIGRALMARGITPDALLGFSLGQLSALALSGMLSDAETFELIAARARAMQAAVEQSSGSMSAFLKANPESIQEVIDEVSQGQVLVAANYNCPGQIVVSGESDAVARAEEAWAARGFKFARLATAGAFHSPLMASAADVFAETLAEVEFAEAEIPLINNIDALPLQASRAATDLARHLIEPVRFDDSIRFLADAGATTFVEIGYGGVLHGLMKRIDKDLVRYSISDRASFDQFVEAMAERDN